MGWANCGTDSSGRRIGYAVRATCDEPGCKTRIDRGLAYACGSQHGSGEFDCDRYFCAKHLYYTRTPDGNVTQLCAECGNRLAEVGPDEPSPGAAPRGAG